MIWFGSVSIFANNVSFTPSNQIEPLLIDIIENESFKQKIVKLHDEIQECKKASLEINEQLNKIKLKEDVSEKEFNVCTTKSLS